MKPTRSSYGNLPGYVQMGDHNSSTANTHYTNYCLNRYNSAPTSVLASLLLDPTATTTTSSSGSSSNAYHANHTSYSHGGLITHHLDSSSPSHSHSGGISFSPNPNNPDPNPNSNSNRIPSPSPSLSPNPNPNRVCNLMKDPLLEISNNNSSSLYQEATTRECSISSAMNDVANCGGPYKMAQPGFVSPVDFGGRAAADFDRGRFRGGPGGAASASTPHTILSSILEQGEDGDGSDTRPEGRKNMSSMDGPNAAAANDAAACMKPGVDPAFSRSRSLNFRRDAPSGGPSVGILAPGPNDAHRRRPSSNYVKPAAGAGSDAPLLRHAASLPSDALSQLTSTMSAHPVDELAHMHANPASACQFRRTAEPSSRIQANDHRVDRASGRHDRVPIVRQRSSPAGFLSELAIVDSELGGGFGVTGVADKAAAYVPRDPSGGLLNHMGARTDAMAGGMGAMPTMADMNRGWSMDIEASSNAEAPELESFGHRKRGRDLETKFFEPLQSGRDLLHLGPLNHRVRSSCEPPHMSHFLIQGSDFDINDTSDGVLCKSRAKRGCATHPRSIAERVRRTKISDRVKKLTDLVPNLDRQAHTADMLDEVVEYVKQLQQEVEELSQKAQKCSCRPSTNSSLM